MDTRSPNVLSSDNGSGALLTGGMAAILASACCLGPLVLITLCFSGVWIGGLTLLEPYSPLFIGLAMLSLLFAWRRIWRPAADCAPGAVCSIPQARRAYKILFSVVVALILLALVFPYAAPWFY